jgi:hypothetical protein
LLLALVAKIFDLGDSVEVEEEEEGSGIGNSRDVTDSGLVGFGPGLGGGATFSLS